MKQIYLNFLEYKRGILELYKRSIYLLLEVIIIHKGFLVLITWKHWNTWPYNCVNKSLLLSFPVNFSHQRQLMVFRSNLTDRESPRESRTLLSIQADPKNTVVEIISPRPLISNSSIPNIKLLGIVPRAPITIGIMILCVIVLWQGPSICLSFRLLWFSLYGPPRRQSPLFGRFSFLFTITWSGLLAKIRWSVFISKSHSLSPGRILVCAYTIT